MEFMLVDSNKEEKDVADDDAQHLQEEDGVPAGNSCFMELL